MNVMLPRFGYYGNCSYICVKTTMTEATMLVKKRQYVAILCNALYMKRFNALKS